MSVFVAASKTDTHAHTRPFSPAGCRSIIYVTHTRPTSDDSVRSLTQSSFDVAYTVAAAPAWNRLPTDRPETAAYDRHVSISTENVRSTYGYLETNWPDLLCNAPPSSSRLGRNINASVTVTVKAKFHDSCLLLASS